MTGRQNRRHRVGVSRQGFDLHLLRRRSGRARASSQSALGTARVHLFLARYLHVHRVGREPQGAIVVERLGLELIGYRTRFVAQVTLVVAWPRYGDLGGS